MSDLDISTEMERLEGIARVSRYAEGLYTSSIEHSFQIFRRYIRPGAILEMGPAEGLMTDRLVTLDQPLSIIEAGTPFCEAIKARHPSIDVNHGLFEQYQPSKRFKTIILGHVLEHVDDPVAILRLAAAWLDGEDAVVLASVPNARSLHRQAAADMGLLATEESLNETDVWHGHRRVYNPETLRNDFRHAGFTVQAFGGYWLKPFANSQLDQISTPEITQAFMKLGERYPDIAGEIYVVASLGRQ